VTWVKICGITNLEDARVAVESGADALGFVFYEKSARRVRAETVREITSRIQARVEKVGVFVDETGENMQKLAKESGLTAIQFHHRLAPAQQDGPRRLRRVRVLPAQFLAGEATPGWVEEKSSFDALLIDTVTASVPGGSGQRFDWNAAAPALAHLSRRFHTVVAGGLDPENVEEAMATLQPWGVDVASGVEQQPGKKDAEKVRAFVAAVRAQDHRRERL
jgi:phosphoribosylanthranilate isomerase